MSSPKRIGPEFGNSGPLTAVGDRYAPPGVRRRKEQVLSAERPRVKT
jgi:hypothetical protein